MYRVVSIFLISVAVPSLITAAGDETSSNSSRSTPQVCVLPEQPDHGAYAVAAPKTAQPGQSYESVVLNFTCNEDYVLTGSNQVFCVAGIWSEQLPQCTQCGTTPEDPERAGRLPWHAGIYTKTTKPYLQMCGGTLISNSLVLSAAHCFWDFSNSSLFPKENYAVALGKTYRPWSDDNDDAQKFDVKDIHIPSHFFGAETNYQHDIAVLVLEQAVKYTVNVMPVCLNFDHDFEKKQLRDGNLGKIGGWNIHTASGGPSAVFKVVEVPYIDIGTCFNQSPYNFRPFFTGNKMCAGKNKDGAFCKGDSGAGLAFPRTDGGVKRYYLRGIMSVAPQIPEGETCGPSYATFTLHTLLSAHEHFIRQYFVPHKQ